MLALLVPLIFLGVFLVCVLVFYASGMAASRETQQTLAVLKSALAVSAPSVPDQAVDLRKKELFSTIPWLHRWLLQIELAPRVRTLLYQANLKWTTGGLLLGCLAAFVIPAYLLYLRTGAIIVSLVIGLLLGYSPFIYVFQKRKQRFQAFERELPEALDLIVSALRAGHSMVSALGLVARDAADPVGPEFRICYDEQNYGLELRTAMENMVTRVPLQDLRIVATAILIQKESGGNLAEVLEKTAHVIRERFRLKRQVRIHTAQGRMTGWILTFLPVVLGFALYLVSPQTTSLLWKRPIGIKLLYASGLMTVTGGLIIRKIVNMDV